jgi:hypothetical protein
MQTRSESSLAAPNLQPSRPTNMALLLLLLLLHGSPDT